MGVGIVAAGLCLAIQGGSEITALLGGALIATGLMTVYDALRDMRYRLARTLQEGMLVVWKTPMNERKEGRITGIEWVQTMGEYRISVLDKAGTAWMVWEHTLA